jgi:hypothetical protein
MVPELSLIPTFDEAKRDSSLRSEWRDCVSGWLAREDQDERWMAEKEIARK